MTKQDIIDLLQSDLKLITESINSVVNDSNAQEIKRLRFMDQLTVHSQLSTLRVNRAAIAQVLLSYQYEPQELTQSETKTYIAKTEEILDSTAALKSAGDSPSGPKMIKYGSEKKISDTEKIGYPVVKPVNSTESEKSKKK